MSSVPFQMFRKQNVKPRLSPNSLMWSGEYQGEDDKTQRNRVKPHSKYLFLNSQVNVVLTLNKEASFL